MEPAKIDWKKVESIFVEDKLYETINAPKWVDFLNPHVHDDSWDYEAWFCRPDCNHPKTAEDFLRAPTSKSSKSPLGSWNLRDAKLKWRWQNQSPFTTSDHRSKFNEDDEENQNPNLSPPPNHQSKSVKSVIKSSTEKKRSVDDISQPKEPPRLKSTLSARNLFSGKDILSHITEFCNELKKMASRAKERESDEKESQVGENREVAVAKKGSGEVPSDGNSKEKERKPLLEVGKEKSEGECVKEKKLRRKKLIDDAENIPSPVLNLENVKHKGEDRMLQIRTNPPSPQCFSATHSSAKTTPSKSSKSRLIMERGILQDLKQNKPQVMKEEESEGKGKSLSTVDGREARGLDVFWFLTPCTLST